MGVLVHTAVFGFCLLIECVNYRLRVAVAASFEHGP